MDAFTATTNAAPDQPALRIVPARGSMTIDNGQSIKHLLLEALENAVDTTVVLDLSGLSAIDLIGLQMVCAMHRSATDRGIRLRVRGSENEVVAAVKSAAGYHSRSRCSGAVERSCILCAGAAGNPQEVSP